MCNTNSHREFTHSHGSMLCPIETHLRVSFQSLRLNGRNDEKCSIFLKLCCSPSIIWRASETVQRWRVHSRLYSIQCNVSFGLKKSKREPTKKTSRLSIVYHAQLSKIWRSVPSKFCKSFTFREQEAKKVVWGASLVQTKPTAAPPAIATTY